MVILLLISIGLAGHTHLLLPAANDPCQTDMSHLDHINELSMFHCIGHTEYVVAQGKKDLSKVAEWDHRHPWMKIEWHLQQGFSEAHAHELLALSTSDIE